MASFHDPWDSISDEHRSLFDGLDGTDPQYLDDFERDTAQELFAAGFGFTADQYEAAGISEDDVHAAREAFFDFMQMDEDSFPWDEWREVMGYE